MKNLKSKVFTFVLIIIALLFALPVWSGYSENMLTNEGAPNTATQIQQQNLTNATNDKSAEFFKNEFEAIMKGKVKRNLHKKVFHPGKKDNFLNDDIKVNERSDKYIFKIDIPAENQKTVRVFIKNNSIILFDRTMTKHKKNSLEQRISNLRYAYYQRIIPLPKNANIEAIQPIQRLGQMIITVDKM